MKILHTKLSKIVLLIGIFLFLPTLGHASAIENSDYTVNPTNFTINVQVGDQCTYLFGNIHSSKMDEYGSMSEIREFSLPLTFNGIEENITINEGTKVNVEVSDINNLYITLVEKYFVLDGPVYYPDPVLVNRSNLALKSDTFDPRLIMTTNQNLINQVYEGNVEWNVEYHLEWNSVEFRKEFYNETYSIYENYEYDLYDGFLRNMNCHYKTENGGWFDFGIHQTCYMNPEAYQLGVEVGSSQIYILKTIKSYDYGQNTYFNDFQISVFQDGELRYYNIREGDKIILEIVDISFEYVKFAVSYILQDSTKITDETYSILDKSTGYFSLQFIYGPPLLLTTNQTLIQQLLPMNFYFTETEVVYSNSWENSNWKQKEEGTWDLASGWLNYFHRAEFDQMQLRNEFEIIASGYNHSDINVPENLVGIHPGDKNILEFKEIKMIGEAGNIINTFTIELADNKSIEMKFGDKIEIKIKEVDGFLISLEMIFHSSITNESVSNSCTTDISKLPNEDSTGHIFIIPTDEQMIKDLFQGHGVVTFNEDKVILTKEKCEGNVTFKEEIIYDLKTGWALKITQYKFINGIEMEKVVAESIEINSNNSEDKKNDNIPTLTPIPYWPTLLFLIVSGLVYRKKRRI